MKNRTVNWGMFIVIAFLLAPVVSMFLLNFGPAWLPIWLALAPVGIDGLIMFAVVCLMFFEIAFPIKGGPFDNR